MISNRASGSRPPNNGWRIRAHSTMAFAAIGDHARLPARFFARLFASDGSLLGR
jgi:hypothetical protein